jgi:hypothetical protein
VVPRNTAAGTSAAPSSAWNAITAANATAAEAASFMASTRMRRDSHVSSVVIVR